METVGSHTALGTMA